MVADLVWILAGQVVSMGQAVDARRVSIENLEVTLRQGSARVNCR
jgi:hypothetical protein